MIKVTKIIYSGGACPYQLEAETEIGRNIYLRYRNGRLRWGFIGKNQVIPDKYEFEEIVGDQYDGMADDELFKEKLKNSLEFPEGFNFESFRE